MTWEIEVRHEGLNKYRLIRGTDKHVAEQKAAAQRAIWQKMWERKQAAEKERQERMSGYLSNTEKKELANQLTDEASEAIEDIENTLINSLSVDNRIDWESLYDRTEFKKPKSEKPELKDIPREPQLTDPKYQPDLSFFDRVVGSRKKRKFKEARDLHNADHRSWQKQRDEITHENNKREEQYRQELKRWESEKEKFLKNQNETNEAIDEHRGQYLSGSPEAIVDYCEMVLVKSIDPDNFPYPDNFPQDFELDYNPETKILVVDYSLPPIEAMPKVKEVKYIQTRDESKESYLSSTAINKLYDSLLYQMVLRTIHELYDADIVEALEAIVFNGWVRSIDKATGQEVNPCILSIQVNREEFSEINLEHIDPKMCFKKLKGVGSSKLHGLSPVAPILDIDREDKRFVSSREVASELDESYNIAAMDWQDFEHLIREVFEKEFSQEGGEVKVTQASRDGGVDAIAFDPDPIRGGKIVIQAKRYTNVVGMSAVRDLFGTVVNEGATKGILITTSDYGPDAYEFAKGKPLTLLSGSNLLHLLEKHGYQAKIDIKEAKQVLATKSN